MASRGPLKHMIRTDAAREAVQAIQQCLDAKLTRKGCTGITTWIKETARAGQPFRVSRAANARGNAGLSIGRVADVMLRKWCDGEPVPTGFARKYLDHAAHALKKEKLMPVATQLAVAMGPLKTEIDLICIQEGKSGRVGIVFVELKTSRQTMQQHLQSYDGRDKKKPYLNVAGLENSERVAHALQADFGAQASHHSFPHLGRFHSRSVVLYATSTGAKIYPIAPFSRSHFEVAPTGTKHSVTERKRTSFPMLPAAAAGGTLIRAMLRKLGHADVRPGGPASCTSTHNGEDCVVGISPNWHRLTKVKQHAVVENLRACAKKKPPWLVARNRQRQWVATPLREA